MNKRRKIIKETIKKFALRRFNSKFIRKEGKAFLNLIKSIKTNCNKNDDIKYKWNTTTKLINK